MRFTETGPSIPIELLQKQQQGEVVFFCGAGISMPQLPSFWTLTDQVMNELGVTPQDRAYKLFHNEITIKQIQQALQEKYPESGELHKTLAALNKPNDTLSINNNVPLDQVFDILQDDYPQYKINKIVHELLNAQKPNTTQHQTILKLSTNSKNKPLVITTNFDLLFEQADNNLKYWEAPLLPRYVDLDSGIIYLHGRLPDDIAVYEQHQRYHHNIVLSSSDFGRAYLTEGWATNFIQYLLEHKTIILLGYSADDPPVKYLLQGLKRKKSTLNKIYAFASYNDEIETEREEYIKQRWHGLGITSILYNKHGEDKDHSNLWQTLTLWADYATDIDQWQKDTIAMAQKNTPETLKPYQRGQVAYLVSTELGATYFLEAIPPVSPEWLCVFDEELRFADPYSKEIKHGSEKINPRDLYGLDDDNYELYQQNKKRGIKTADLLSALPHEKETEQETLYNSLNVISNNKKIYNIRLHRLLKWLVSVSNHPVTIWWVLTKNHIHSQFLELIENELKSNPEKYTSEQIDLWLLILESYQSYKNKGYLEGDINYDRFLFRVEHDGDDISLSTLRYLEKLIQPNLVLTVKNYNGYLYSKPIDNQSLIKNIQITLQWPNIKGIKDNKIANEKIPYILNIITNTFLYALSFYNDDRFNKYNGVKQYLSVNNNQQESSPNALLHWSIELLKQYSTFDKLKAKKIIYNWQDEPYFFNNLKLQVYIETDIFTHEEAIEFYNNLSITKNNITQAQILLKKYWCSFSNDNYQKISDKIRSLMSFSSDLKNTILIFLRELEREEYPLTENLKIILEENKDTVVPIISSSFVDMSLEGNSLLTKLLAINDKTTIPDFMEIDSIVEKLKKDKFFLLLSRTDCLKHFLENQESHLNAIFSQEANQIYLSLKEIDQNMNNFEKHSFFFEEQLKPNSKNREYSCTILIRHIQYFYDINPSWTERILLPLFKKEHELAKAAYFSLIYTPILSDNLLEKIELNDLSNIQVWFNEYTTTIEKTFGKMITMLSLKKPNFLSHREASQLLQSESIYIRLGAISALKEIDINKEQWNIFIKNIWPSKIDFQTENTTKEFIYLAIHHKKFFPDIVKDIIDYLKSIDSVIIDECSLMDGPSEIVRNLNNFLNTTNDESYYKATFDILSKTMPKEMNFQNNNLSDLLDKIANKIPDIKNDKNWRRLKSL